ncbi:glycosyltransferase family 2 protein [Paraflavitalea sp. CAU 1676]|uniref:glycosyltransferase family 2 protein n=1 Tax=Paraflavitalea sp. CAU 1676 TaxID=3032598 RepID=UPI0023DB1603|nr:glycosyltransferase family 2 protein [Paraflavitalea sp. CAU 1676]MDF2188994.1 glycosyltransferase family 2 protein [Paraflavitalea sp. CAU 1676]
MISVLIPVYNQDVKILIARLSAGLSHLENGGEIIVMDDGSEVHTLEDNESITSLPGVRYIPLHKNYGRLKVRQFLAKEAAGEWLLFLDGDSVIDSGLFVRQYEKAIGQQPAAIVGGRTYTTTPPENCQLHLHWQYGTHRESRHPGKKHQPAFMTNNFMIPAWIFNQLKIGAQWEGYGHEDTWIGILLEQAGIPVVPIDNPVLHDGLETAGKFIEKSKDALANLSKISTTIPEEDLTRHVKLFRVHQALKKWRLTWAPVWINKLLERYVLRNLHSCHPSLRLFDLYRLAYFSRLQQQKAGSHRP